MVSYDSDSSGDDGGSDYVETSVLLGYASKEPTGDPISHLGGRPTFIEATSPPSAAYTRCKICRDFMVLLLQLNGDLPEHFPGHERRLYVFGCRRKTCRRKEGSVRVLRGIRVSEDSRKNDAERMAKVAAEAERRKAQTQPQSRVITSSGIGESLFGAKAGKTTVGGAATNPFSSGGVKAIANPFSTPATNAKTLFSTTSLSELAAKPPQNAENESPVTKESTTSTELPKSFAQALNLNNPTPISRATLQGPAVPPESWPPEAELPLPYPKYFLDADYETLDKVEEDVPIPKVSMDLDDDNAGAAGSGGAAEDKDTFESTIDSTFQKFADRLSQNPEQVIRYEYKGNPLLYSKTDVIGKLLSTNHHVANQKIVVSSGGAAAMSRAPRCVDCGSARVFEVQLTPHAILELESEELGVEGMEWGTILIGVCERDCLPWDSKRVDGKDVGFIEEWAAVQWEEVSEKRR